MPWVIGIDEAGYGPNLGPLVQAAVPLKLPESDLAGWDVFRSVIRRTHETVDGRVLIDDSKKVYSQGGLEALEQGVRAAFVQLRDPTVGDLIRQLSVPGVREELAREAWYEAAESVPVVAKHEAIRVAGKVLGEGSLAERAFGNPAAVVVPAPRFNRICAASGTKATVLSRGLVELLSKTLQELSPDGEPVLVTCDKHGGRNFYAAMVQEAFPDGWVITERESPIESRYRVELLSRPISIVFRPRADGASVAVALASMLCKYLREICMRQFNRFWAKHIPGLKPTAGYPVDARRFFAEIQPLLPRLGLTDDCVWRKK